MHRMKNKSKKSIKQYLYTLVRQVSSDKFNAPSLGNTKWKN